MAPHLCIVVAGVFASAAGIAAGVPLHLETVLTAFSSDGPDFAKYLEPMPDQAPESLDTPPSEALIVDTSTKFQTILGFGGAFTAAAAENWMKLTASDQQKVVHMYFGDPRFGGHGYTIGRVPMGSSDFSPASYSFDNASGDDELKFFDEDVTRDEVNGMLPLMRAATDMVSKRGEDPYGRPLWSLNIFASPWSPPAWMKNPMKDGTRSLDGSPEPLGLNRSYMRTWANYFSKFIDAYKRKGIDLWGVTPQNEPEYAPRWEGCVYTPEYEAEFIRDHLGPVLHNDHPGVKIIGFDHNKDHVVEWAKVLYGDNETKKYIDGIGVHWYGGLNTEHLDETNSIAPDKFILATEACNCPNVVYQDKTKSWWSRAEKLAIDILEDLKWWSVGWTDWNLMVNTEGGPNHVGNNCDANIITDPKQTKGYGSVIVQASYYYMGHFSRFLPRGSRRVGIKSTVKAQPKLHPFSVNGKALQFLPCDANTPSQTWTYNEHNKTLSLFGLPEMCAELNIERGNAIKMRNCDARSRSQKWTKSSDDKFINDADQKCLTEEKVQGQKIGLDPGLDALGGFTKTCSADLPPLEQQSFSLTGAFPHAFHVTSSKGDCMLPVGTGDVVFDAVAFQTPTGDNRIVAMNMKEVALTFDIYDAKAKIGFRSVTLPAHSIATYSWQATAEEVSAYV